MSVGALVIQGNEPSEPVDDRTAKRRLDRKTVDDLVDFRVTLDASRTFGNLERLRSESRELSTEQERLSVAEKYSRNYIPVGIGDYRAFGSSCPALYSQSAFRSHDRVFTA
ncbi:MAG: hypothetical protein ACLR5G_10265 [Eubacteriales bacterium]